MIIKYMAMEFPSRNRDFHINKISMICSSN